VLQIVKELAEVVVQVLLVEFLVQEPLRLEDQTQVVAVVMD
tara:strand:+ start:101 stop:223 length:123 start_codon:yes stop_codon:yes gene_type:complete